MLENLEESRRELRQIALLVAQVEKRPAVDDKVREEPAFPMGPLPEPPPLPVHQEAIPMTAPLIAPIQARMGSGGSGTARLGSSPAWIVMSSF